VTPRVLCWRPEVLGAVQGRSKVLTRPVVLMLASRDFDRGRVRTPSYGDDETERLPLLQAKLYVARRWHPSPAPLVPGLWRT
jgi:hypothetical protein